MELTAHEKRMLNGDLGPAPRFAMEVLVKLGQIYGADCLVEVASAQIMAHYGSLHDAGLELAEKFVALGGRFLIPTTEDPLSICERHWRDLGIAEEYAAKQERLRRAVLALGAQPAWTCTPYLAGNLPRFGQNVSWAESSAVSFANSVLGARTNRTPAGLNYCAALTGRMPRMGLYRPENRRGQVLISVDAGELSRLDYNTLGLIIGKRVGNRVPVVEGLPESTGVDDLKYLGAAAASSGVVALYHAPGLTPEASAGDPFGGQAPAERLLVDRDALTAMRREMNTALGEPELGVVGCAPLLGAGDGPAGRPAAGPPPQAGPRAVGLHLAHGGRAGPGHGLRGRDHRRRGAHHGRQLPGHLAPGQDPGEDHGHRLGQGGLLPALRARGQDDLRRYRRAGGGPGGGVAAMQRIVLKGRGILPGVAEGRALVSDEQIVWSHGVEPWRGVIDDSKVKLNGQSIKGKVFVYPYGKGSTSSSTWILETIRCGNAPAAIINRETELIITTGFLYGQLLYGAAIPVVDHLDQDPLAVIASGDLVRVDGAAGLVEVFKS